MTSLLVPHAATSASLARHRMVLELQSLGVPVALVDDAALVLSELLGNAVRHGSPVPGGGVRVRWELLHRPDGDVVRVEVVDGGRGVSADRDPMRDAGSQDAEGGRGLSIVSMLARDWGHDATSATSVVWAELLVQGARPVPGADRPQRRSSSSHQAH